MKLEGHILQPVGADILVLQDYFVSGIGLVTLIVVIGFVAQHHRDQVLNLHLIPLQKANLFAISEHRAAVCDQLHFFQVVGDVDDRQPPLLQLADDLQQTLLLIDT